MLCRTLITDLNKQSLLGVVLWERKGSKEKGYKLSGFTVYINSRGMLETTTTTASKTKHYLQSLYRLHKLKNIKTEDDLEIFSNMFIAENQPNILFDDEMHYTFTLFKNFKMPVMRNIVEHELKNYILNDIYLKQEFINKLKKFRKGVRNG